MNKLYLFLLLALFTGCSEFISPDASSYLVRLLGPADSLHCCQDQFSFWWEPAPIAEHYRFQLVNPDFERPLLHSDTLLDPNRIDLSLAEGVYSWRLRIENAASFSPFSTRSLVVDCAPPLPAVPLFPKEGDTLSFEKDPLILQWHSTDQALDGFVFPVADSVFLYEIHRAQLHLKGLWFTRDKQVAITQALEAPGKGNARMYCWRVVSVDQAGNTRRSNEFTFVLE